MIVDNYVFKTTPFDHQLEEWKYSRELKTRAIFWEQGTGKSKLVIDTVAWLYGNGLIDAFIVVAPNGVQRNWVTDELPTHLPDDIKYYAHIFETVKSKTKWHQKALERTRKFKGLSVLVISYNAFVTEAGKRAVWEFLRDRKCMYTLDESHRIKSMETKRTEAIVKSSVYADYKRILTGTPISVGPFDMFAQICFLALDYWEKLGISTYLAFQHKFGVYQKWEVERKNKRTGKPYKKKLKMVVAYKNLGILNKMLEPISSRVKKEDVLDIPPKLFTKRYCSLSKEQRALYDELKEEFMVEFEDELVTAEMAIVRLLRLQQITCGYLPADGGDPVMEIAGGNPKMDTLLDTLEDQPGKVIIWARFTRDIEMIAEALGDQCATYYGKNTDEEREEAKFRFQGQRVLKDDNGQVVGREPVPEEEQVRYFVGNPAVGSEGLTLHAAKTVIYYNNSFKFIDRLQSEDRAHRIGQEDNVEYIDIVAEDTVDEHIVKNLLKKYDIASQITGDELREWI